ncbi:MAG: hypothetical protein IPJ65_27170 [Archangiaceae bacterium]|nr:hypothetical protein [Archangiaceae bacterium]
MPATFKLTPSASALGASGPTNPCFLEQLELALPADATARLPLDHVGLRGGRGRRTGARHVGQRLTVSRRLEGGSGDRPGRVLRAQVLGDQLELLGEHGRDDAVERLLCQLRDGLLEALGRDAVRQPLPDGPAHRVADARRQHLEHHASRYGGGDLAHAPRW